MTVNEAAPTVEVRPSSVRMARALVHDAQQRGTRESPSIERIANTPLREDGAANHRR